MILLASFTQKGIMGARPGRECSYHG